MFFSGHISEYRCEKCHSTFREVIPTSLPAALIVMLVSAIPWTQAFLHFTSYRILAIPAAIIMAGGSLYAIDLVVDLLMSWKLPGQSCPRCEGQLRHSGGGFYDSFVPNLWEFVVYALTLGLAFSTPWTAKFFW